MKAIELKVNYLKEPMGIDEDPLFFWNCEGGVKQGATSIWEDWEGKLSQNHYSPGAVCEWLFDTMGGIRVAGENRFTIAPQPGKGVDFADVSYKSLYGRVSCSWKKENGKIVYKITVPSNCRAAIKLPNEKTMNVETGEYRYEI